MERGGEPPGYAVERFLPGYSNATPVVAKSSLRLTSRLMSFLGCYGRQECSSIAGYRMAPPYTRSCMETMSTWCVPLLPCQGCVWVPKALPNPRAWRPIGIKGAARVVSSVISVTKSYIELDAISQLQMLCSKGTEPKTWMFRPWM
jgi:hypothetical protein